MLAAINNRKTSKKALSEILSYVLLIVIALSISTLAYTFLKGYIFKDVEECSPDLSLVIKDYSCDAGTLNLTLENKGLFDISGFYLRSSEEVGKDAINPVKPRNDVFGDGKVSFLETEGWLYNLEPGQDYNGIFVYQRNIAVIQVQPFTYSSKGNLLLCKSTNQELDC